MAPSARTLSVAIVGAGFGGVGMAIRLLQAGFDDVTVLERADRVGGVQAANSYPGAACDIPASLYSFSFVPKADWTRRYPPQQEIQAYLHETAERLGVLPRIRFGVEVRAARFDEDRARWVLDLADGPSGHPRRRPPSRPTSPGCPRWSCRCAARRSCCRTTQPAAAISLARLRTASSIGSVNLPVKVFCWLTW